MLQICPSTSGLGPGPASRSSNSGSSRSSSRRSSSVTTTTTATTASRRASDVRAHQLLEQQRQRQQQQRRPVAGRKTFTGCWTCRARKRKCDEAFPHCLQCTKKNLVCEGYSARLQWLPCELGGPGVGPPAPVRTVSSQRRQISFSIPSAVLDDAELDRLLLDLDEAPAPAPAHTTLRGPFGVFPARDAGTSAPLPALSAPMPLPSPPAAPVHAGAQHGSTTGAATSLYDGSLFSPSMAFAQVLEQQQQQQQLLQLQQQTPRHLHAHPHAFHALPAVAPGDLDAFGGCGGAPGDDGTSVPMAWDTLDDMWAGLTLGSMLLQQQQQQSQQQQSQSQPSPGGPTTPNGFGGSSLSLFDLLEHDLSGTAVSAVTGPEERSGPPPHALDGLDGLVGGQAPAGSDEEQEVEDEDDPMDGLALHVHVPVSSSSTSSSALALPLPSPERPLTPASFLLQPKMRFLLSHYMHHVVNSFCISTRTTRSPWKSIHLPRALQGSGELAVMGATSHARSALLNALLAVSAYCLANRYAAGTGTGPGRGGSGAGHHRRPDDAAEAARWRKVGSQLRLQVLSSLRRGLADGLASAGGGARGGGAMTTSSPPTAYSAADLGASSPSPDADRLLFADPAIPTHLSLAIAAGARPKYKELLAAMLSMVSVDVASGDTATTRTHLLGCESLIRSAQAWKRHYSAKARALHRIFYYLRVIYASTNLVDTFDEDVEEEEGGEGVVEGEEDEEDEDGNTTAAERGSEAPDATDSHTTTRPPPTGPSAAASATAHRPPRHKGTRAWLEETLLESSETAASCEFIYGVPASLLILLARVTDHVRRLDRLGGGGRGGRGGRGDGTGGGSGSGSGSGGGGGHRHRRPSMHDGATLSPHEAALAAESDRLEAEVLTFPVDALLADGGGGGSGDSDTDDLDRAILQHQTRAFHQALVLYFCQNIRAMHALHLRPYVEAVLRHAEAIEAIKRRQGVPSGTLYWPCFVAASEAVDPALQQRFLHWYETTYGAGFAGCLRGRDIVAEVWRRRRAGWPRERSTWRAVVESQNACLMLT